MIAETDQDSIEAARSFATTTRRLGIADADALAAITAELGGDAGL